MKPEGFEVSKLTLTIKNIDPLEVRDISEMLLGLDREFKRFIAAKAPRQYRKYHLYLNQVREGSQQFELISMIPMVFGGIENFNSLFEFAKHLQKIFNRVKSDDNKTLSQQIGEDKIDITSKKNLSKIINPMVKDKGSQMNLSATYQENHFHFNLDSDEAKEIQKNLKLVGSTEGTDKRFSRIVERYPDRRQMDVLTYDEHKIVFYWYQDHSTALDFGIIESIYDKPLKVEFDNDQAEHVIRYHHDNPYSIAFVIDVRVESFKGRPIMYKILKFHYTIDPNESL